MVVGSKRLPVQRRLAGGLSWRGRKVHSGMTSLVRRRQRHVRDPVMSRKTQGPPRRDMKTLAVAVVASSGIGCGMRGRRPLNGRGSVASALVLEVCHPCCPASARA